MVMLETGCHVQNIRARVRQHHRSCFSVSPVPRETEYRVSVSPVPRETEYRVSVCPVPRETECRVSVCPVPRETEYRVSVCPVPRETEYRVDTDLSSRLFNIMLARSEWCHPCYTCFYFRIVYDC
jgi:hypothetical protein